MNQHQYTPPQNTNEVGAIFHHRFPIEPTDTTIGYQNGQQFHLQVIEDDLQALENGYFEVDIPSYLQHASKIHAYYKRKSSSHYHDFMYIFQDTYIELQILDKDYSSIKQPSLLFSIDPTSREGYAELYEMNTYMKPNKQDTSKDIYFSHYVNHIPKLERKTKQKKVSQSKHNTNNDLLLDLIQSHQELNDVNDEIGEKSLPTIPSKKPTKLNVRFIPKYILNKLHHSIQEAKHTYGEDDIRFRIHILFDFVTQSEPVFTSLIRQLYSYFHITPEMLGIPSNQGAVFP